MFQFLIGSMKVGTTTPLLSMSDSFQFLIGSMKAEPNTGGLIARSAFQFLIGSMKAYPIPYVGYGKLFCFNSL